MNRRKFLMTGAGACLLAGGSAPAALPSVSPMAAFDQEVSQYMWARKIPGGALAVVRHRRLIYARGYGLANRESKVSATAATLFRIASLSKPITAAAVFKLIEAGQLRLTDRVFERLALSPVGEGVRDARLPELTVRQLLQHTAGWDRVKSFDPMFNSRRIARAAGVASPPDSTTIIRYMLGRSLDFVPDTRFCYSNFGYCVLGRVIEQAAKTSYAQYVQEQVLKPAGVNRMRLGASLRQAAAPDEAAYYTVTDETDHSVFDAVSGRVPAPYGGFCLESMDAHGGWLASVTDLARFAVALEPGHAYSLLSPATLKSMYAPPPAPVFRTQEGKLADTYYAGGWSVHPWTRADQVDAWHSGSLPGTSSLLVRLGRGLTWVALFNQRSDQTNLPDLELDAALHRAAVRVARWPEEDLFPSAAASAR